MEASEDGFQYAAADGKGLVRDVVASRVVARIHVADFDPIRNGRSRAQKATDNAADNSADFLGYAVGLSGGDDIAGLDVVSDVVAAEKDAGLRSAPTMSPGMPVSGSALPE